MDQVIDQLPFGVVIARKIQLSLQRTDVGVVFLPADIVSAVAVLIVPGGIVLRVGRPLFVKMFDVVDQFGLLVDRAFQKRVFQILLHEQRLQLLIGAGKDFE